MTDLMLPKTVRSVRVVGDSGANEIYRNKKKNKKAKDSKLGRPLRKEISRALKGEKDALGDVHQRFDKSSKKKKDGWLQDGSKNVFKSARKSDKRFKKLYRF